MEQIQNTIHKDNNGFSVEIHHTVRHDSINSACDIVNSSPTDTVDYAVRPQGQQKTTRQANWQLCQRLVRVRFAASFGNT